MAKHLKVQQKQKEEQCPGRRRRFYQLRPFCSILSSPLSLSLSCPPPAPSSPLTFNFAPPTLLICPLSGKFVKQCWSSPSWPDLVSGLSQLDLLALMLVPQKQVATGGLSALTKHLRSYLPPPETRPTTWRHPQRRPGRQNQEDQCNDSKQIQQGGVTTSFVLTLVTGQTD